MITRVVLVGWFLAAMAQPLGAAQAPPNAEETAQKAAEAWLALVDGAKYAESWAQASSTFKKAVTAEQWTNAVTMARTPFGAFTSRSINSRQYTTSLPGAPPGQYVLLTFDSHFAQRLGVETIVMMLEPDGAWRVAGAFIR
jgi:hypothetical protein